jgi:5-methylcytosine-specific restriction endonuclease McrA
VLTIPQEKAQKAKDAIEKVCSYHHIPEADLMVQVSTMFRGWCNYYRYANSPQPVFGRLSKDAWWAYAHYLARKQRSSIAAILRREKLAKRLVVVKHNGRRKQTFQTRVGYKTLTLNIIPPKTGSIQAIHNKQEWTADLKPMDVLNWQSGRSLTTRLTALDRANGVCERCKTNPVQHVHHTVPVKGKTFLARVMSDKSQREMAIALCEECHLEAHGGSFRPRTQRLGRNAGCAERCLSGVGSAVEKPAAEMR